MSAADAPPGSHHLGHLELDVGEDQIVRLPGGSNFAGSALRPADAVRRAATVLNRSWREVWPHFSNVPADWMGMNTDLTEGSPADFCLVKTNPAGELESVDVPTGPSGEADPG